MLLKLAGDEFLVHCRVAKNLSAHSLRAYAIDLAEFQQFFGGDRKVGEVDRNSLRAYLRHLFDVRHLKETSIKRRLACLKVLFRWLEQEDVIPITPFHRFDGRLKLPQRLPRALSRPEMRQLLDHAGEVLALGAGARYEAGALARLGGPADRAPNSAPATRYADLSTLMVLETLYRTGMRVGELATVRLTDIAAEAGVITVTGKGNRQRRVFLPSESLLRLLRCYLAARAARQPAHDAFILSPGGGQPTTHHLRMMVRGAAEAAGLERRITPHMLRHTAATHLLEAGVDIRFVQRLLGHQSISTTEGYTCVTDEALREVIWEKGGR